MVSQFEIVINDTQVETVLMLLERETSAIGMASFLESEVEPYFKNQIEEKFDTEGGTIGWASLAPSTVYVREALGYGSGPILDRTGAMRDFITGSSSRFSNTGVGLSVQIPGDSPSNLEIYKAMLGAQYGIRNNKTPARPIFNIDEQDVFAILEKLTQKLVLAMAGL